MGKQSGILHSLHSRDQGIDALFEFVVSKIPVWWDQPAHRRNTSLPGGTEDVTSLKRAIVETLSFWHSRLRSLQNGISERKPWMYSTVNEARYGSIFWITIWRLFEALEANKQQMTEQEYIEAANAAKELHDSI